MMIEAILDEVLKFCLVIIAGVMCAPVLLFTHLSVCYHNTFVSVIHFTFYFMYVIR